MRATAGGWRCVPAWVAVAAIVATATLTGCGGSEDDDAASLSDDEIADIIDENAPTSLPTLTSTTLGDEASQEAFDALDDLEEGGGEATEGFQTLISGDLVVEVPGDWQDIDLEPGTGGETSIRAAPALSEFGNGGIGLAVSVYEEAYPPATVFDTLERGLSTADFGVPVSGCAEQQEVDFPGNSEMTATVRVYGTCDGADTGGVYLLGSFTPTEVGDTTLGVYAFATTSDETDDLVYSLSTLSLEGFQP